MSDSNTSIAAQIACIKRELSMRSRVYPRLVARGRMTQIDSDDEIAVMKAVLATLQAMEQGLLI